MEHCIRNQKLMFSTELQEGKAVAVTSTNAIFSEDVLPGLVITPTRALKLPRMINFSVFGTAVTRELSSS